MNNLIQLLIRIAYLVRRSLSEYVAHVRARYNFQGTSTHPRFEGQLEILATPNVEARVVRAQPVEERLVNGEQAAGHCRGMQRLGRILRGIEARKWHENNKLFLIHPFAHTHAPCVVSSLAPAPHAS